jgi:glucarate dehydratase
VFLDGALDVPDAPGLGIELDRRAVSTLHQRWLDLGIRDRDDVAAMQIANPDWKQPALPRY